MTRTISKDLPPLSQEEIMCFRAMHNVAEAIRAMGVTGADVWALMFAQLQDLQAGDLGMGSDAHREEVQAQHDSLADTLANWDAGTCQGTA